MRSSISCAALLAAMLLAMSAMEPARDSHAQEKAKPTEVADLLRAVTSVKIDAEGSPEARAARDKLAALGPEVLGDVLLAMDGANAVAANWLRTVFDEIVARELAQPKPKLPLDELETYVAEARHNGRARRLVLAVLDKERPEFRAALLPRLLDDPEFRPDAVDQALKKADGAKRKGDKPAAIAAYQTAFQHAREPGQLLRAARELAALGQTADVRQQLGLVVDWQLLGPFDAPGYSGFKAVFAPESKVDLGAEYAGQGGAAIRWRRHATTDELGVVNFAQAVAQVREAVGYAYTELESPRDQEAEMRCGADDNCTVWLNGQKVFGREQWLNGTRFDRFRAAVRLKKGKNTVLVKVCQGPQHKDPGVPNNWSLQLRFCDATGAGVGLVSMLPATESEK
jgi:hypothetical protein